MPPSTLISAAARCPFVVGYVLCQPFRRTGGTGPRGGVTAHILLCFIFSAHRDVGRRYPREFLPAQQVGRHMGVDLQGLPELGFTFRRVAAAPEVQQGGGVAPLGRMFPAVAVEQGREVLITIEVERSEERRGGKECRS